MTTNIYFTYQSIIDLGQPRGKTIEDLLTLADPDLRVELVLRMEDLGPPYLGEPDPGPERHLRILPRQLSGSGLGRDPGR